MQSGGKQRRWRESLVQPFVMDSRGEAPNGPLEVIRRLLMDPGYRAVVMFRVAERLATRYGHSRLCRAAGALIRVRLARVPGVEINTIFPVGEGLKMFHPHDIVIGYGARIGKNVTIYNGVTIGGKRGRGKEAVGDRYPVIQDDVTIYPGAKVIGPIVVGRGAIIGANAVVVRDVEPGTMVVGNPAKPVRRGSG